MTFTYAPAASFTERAGLFVSLTGGTNSGKTFSALRLARGIAGRDGKVAVLDTEGGRTLHLKEAFAFDANVMQAPFRPERFGEAALAAEKAGYDVLVIDSFSMEWVGVGGVLDWQAEEHARMGGKDSTKGASWIKPKVAHKAMVYSLLQRRIPIVFSIRGEETFVPPNKTIFKSITNKAFPFEVTVSFRLAADRKGYIDLSDPLSFKMEGAHRQIFRDGDRINEDQGAALAAWARGDSGARETHAETPEPSEPRQPSTRDRLFTAARAEAAKGSAALRLFRDGIDPKADKALAPILAELERTAEHADDDDGFPGFAGVNGEAA